jgi:methylamine dehydrogenase light chain
MDWLDRLFERSARRVAQSTSRRSALVRIGKALVGTAAVFPVLPFARLAQAQHGAAGGAGKPVDETSCEYWRYCGIDGPLCSCCGGSPSMCPPGTALSKASWVGTCLNPRDNKQYLVQYNDCCGRSTCARCICNNNVGERPGYRMGLHNDINWCMSNTGLVTFHCTLAAVVAVVEARK